MRWDLFCNVIDNYGDVGVCWRLARALADRGQTVRLWLDDPAPLSWMAPEHTALAPAVTVHPWPRAQADGLEAADAPGDVLIEAFGCDPPSAYIARIAAQRRPPTWINLEYLSAEGYVERCHRLPSPVMSGPGAGLVKHFFYPGFTSRTGGLLRPQQLADTAAPATAAQRQRWLTDAGMAHIAPPAGERWVSLFCYEPPALADLLRTLAAQPTPHRLWVTQGRAAAHLQRVLAATPPESASNPPLSRIGSLSISCLPALTQAQFDALLDACDVNFVRGEDSLVRALWAGRPAVWQLYPQHDGAHWAKLHAYLDTLPASTTLRQWHVAWNREPGSGEGQQADWPALCADASLSSARTRLLMQADLAAQLLDFAHSCRST